MANDRVAQEPVEAIVLPDNQKAALAQEVVEVIYPSDNPTGGGSHAWAEIIG